MTTKWTYERVEVLKAMVAANFPASDIGERLGISRDAVLGKARRLGLSLPKKPDIAVAKRRHRKTIGVRNSRQNDVMREYSAAKRAAGLRHANAGPRAKELAARLAEIPADTRNLTARIFGDPLPGRSALDRSVR